jgi:adenylate cyclase class IV
MSKLEKEVKVLNVDVQQLQKKLENIGAKNKGEKNQKIYVYDIPTLYHRFLEIRDLLNSDSEMIVNTNLKKLEVLILELNDLLKDEKRIELLQFLNIKTLDELTSLPLKKIIDILYSDTFENEIKSFGINPNKWIRLRKSNNKIELTTKHILEKQNNKFQNVIETEIEVSSLEETNRLLENIGIARRSYQEKIRYSYEYKTAEIEIDIWPQLDPYMEIECDDENIIEEIIEKLDLKNNEIVSLNTEQLYKRIGIDVHSMSELKF